MALTQSQLRTALTGYLVEHGMDEFVKTLEMDFHLHQLTFYWEDLTDITVATVKPIQLLIEHDHDNGPAYNMGIRALLNRLTTDQHRKLFYAVRNLLEDDGEILPELDSDPEQDQSLAPEDYMKAVRAFSRGQF